MTGDRPAAPADLAPPVDDGACDHLTGMRLPSLELAFDRRRSDRPRRAAGALVVYCFPRAGQPDVATPAGWDQIAGRAAARPSRSPSATTTARSVRCAEVFGLSAQSPEAQAEIAARLGLPFALLSDAGLGFARALKLPTFEAAGMTLIRRLTLIVTGGAIEKVFYPVFPPIGTPTR